ncbi:MAG TPA: hypothetical protein VMZ69_07535 [Saprospiraceae bacterium]|nr:hypothetical protein [Saprospiraceae bacterium]
MKNLFFFLLPLLLLSCKGVEQHRGAIEELSANWDTTTKAITDFKAMVSSDLTNYTQALAAMQPADASKMTMTPEQSAAWEASMKTVTDALGAYSPLLKTVSDFEATWAEKSAEVTALKDGLAAGKIEGDVNAKITELNAMIATANENLASWKTAYASIKGSVDAAMAGLHSGAPANMGGTTIKK